MALAALLSRFKLWKISLSIFLISSIDFYVLVLLDVVLMIVDLMMAHGVHMAY